MIPLTEGNSSKLSGNVSQVSKAPETKLDAVSNKQNSTESNKQRVTPDDVSYEYIKKLDLVKVVLRDSASNQVVKTIPTKDYIEMRLRLQDYIGTLLNKKA